MIEKILWCINKIYYLYMSCEKPLHCSLIFSRENNIHIYENNVYLYKEGLNKVKKIKDKKYIFSKQSTIMN